MGRCLWWYCLVLGVVALEEVVLGEVALVVLARGSGSGGSCPEEVALVVVALGEVVLGAVALVVIGWRTHFGGLC